MRTYRTHHFLQIILAGFAFLAGDALAVDCNQDEITLSSQAEVDNFQAVYGPGCDTIVTSLTVSGSGITDLTPLSGLTTGGWGSKIIIADTSVTTLAGLDGLTSVSWFEINNNSLLTSLSALSSLTANQGPLFIQGNPLLTNLDGLQGLTVLNYGALYIQSNASLTDLSGVANISSIGASLVVSDNDALTDLDDLAGLSHVAANISISFNDALTNIGGLSGLVNFSAGLDVRYNSKLTSLGDLPNLTDLSGLALYANNVLAEVDGLSALQTLGDSLGIQYNYALTNLNGLAGLVSVGYNVTISNNYELADCSALKTLLDDVDDAQPGPGPGPAGIPDVGNDVTVIDNTEGCNSVADITGELPPPDIELLPDHGGLGSSVGVRSITNPDDSCGWAPGETIEFWWDTPEAMLGSTTADETGCFETLFVLDTEKIDASTAGAHLVEVRGATTGTSSHGYEQVDPQLILQPPQGGPGRVVTALGCNWDGASSVEVTWLGENVWIDTLPVDGGGCIDSPLKMPRQKNGLFAFVAESDNALSSAAVYQMFTPGLELIPPEGPANTHIPAIGCNWFPAEVIEYKFAHEDQVIDTGGTDHLGCLAPNSAAGSTVFIPPETPAGEYVIQATGQTSNLRARADFSVVERSLEFDPPEGLPGETVAVRGCGWVGNASVDVEWGYPDTNNQPIVWRVDVDAQNGCFGVTTPFEIEVPPNTITGPLEQTATGNEAGTATAEFMVNHGGKMTFPHPDGVVGHSFAVDIQDAIVGESIVFYWDQIAFGIVLGVANAVTPDFRTDITLPAHASVGGKFIVASGSKGFRSLQGVNIIDQSRIAVTNTGDILTGGILELEGENWPGGRSVRFKLVKGQDEWHVGRVHVPDGTTTFATRLPLPVDAPAGDYTLDARTDNGYQSQAQVTLVPGPLPAFSLAASYATTPPALDGVLAMGEWDYEQTFVFTNGSITARSDETRLYVLLNVFGDTTADALGNDNFWLSFDVLGNNVIDAGWDLNFRLAGNELVLDEYTGPDSFDPRTSTFLRSAFAAGFDCFTADGSAEADFNSIPPVLRCDKHRVYEIAIDLHSILAEPGDLLKVGVRAQSQTPAFSEDLPADFHSDFSDLGIIQLAASTLPPVPPAGMVTGIGVNGYELEITQAIQDADNSMQLAADKATAVRVFPAAASEALVRTYLYGRRNGNKLPGSPLVSLATIPAAPDRNDINHSANFLLPSSWTTGGSTELMAVSENWDGQNTRTHLETFLFTERVIPNYWVVPINAGTAASPNLPANSDIATQQSYTETLFPVHEITWVRKDWTDVGAIPIGTKKAKDWLPDVNDELNAYYDDLVATHATSLQESGQEPFTLPDQVYGFTPSGGGLASTVGSGGAGRVSSGFFGTSGDITMAHEINHNLDMQAASTWGRHTTDSDDDADDPDWGCHAEGGNTDWPRTNDEIGETGFDTRLPWSTASTNPLTVVPDNWPDYMSYCRSEAESNAVSGQEPFKWVSEYRWEKQYPQFTPPPAALSTMAGSMALPGNVYYVSGTVQPAGTGSLNPVKIQPGTPTPVFAPGDWTLEIQAAGGAVLWSTTFHVSFKSEEGEDVEFAHFRFRLPYQETGARIVLKNQGAIIDFLEASANPPTVEILVPSGGETWGSEETAIWIADDADGDELEFSLMYSPDGGARWYPLANGLTGTDYTFSTAGLPGGNGGKLRLVATDGFHTVTADSYGVFTLPDPMPSVMIGAPLDGQVFLPGDWVPMRGRAFLPGGGEENLSYAWFIDGEVFELGSEARSMLEEGSYALTLMAYDSSGASGSATVIVEIQEPDPPNEPILPIPIDGGNDEAIDVALSWLGGDPDGDAVSYDVYLDADDPAPTTLVCNGLSIAECRPEFLLAPETLYYWKVVARDGSGLESSSETWSFTTGIHRVTGLIFGDGFE